MERREFLKTSCSLCAGLGTALIVSGLSSCSTPLYTAEVINNTLRVPRSLFSESNFKIIRPKNFSYDIAVQKLEDGSYSALLLSCTHASNQLTFTGNSFFCKLHGSTYNKLGQVTKGPAEQSLKEFAVQVSDNDLLITIE